MDFREENLTTLEQKVTYGKIHGMYKKALRKALQNKLNSQQLIDLLQEFTEDGDNDQLDLDEADERVIDKENVDPVPFHLQNPKVHRGKGRPVGTKRFKSAHEPSKLNSKQRRCKK